MKYIIYPYKIGSKSAKVLAKTLGTTRVYSDGKYVPKRKHVVINWGNSKLPDWWYLVDRRNVVVLNEPKSVRIAKDKLETLKVLRDHDINVPKFTTDMDAAIRWIEYDECKVMCRTLLSSHSGKGIVVAKELEDLVDAPLYTQYVKKTHEFRVHVFRGEVIDYVQKKKKAGFEDRNKYVRSVENGWVFCRDDIEVRDDVKTIAVDAVNVLGLDFGAVDVVLGHDGEVYVLEVNTAIGMEGTTIVKYKQAFDDYLEAL